MTRQDLKEGVYVTFKDLESIRSNEDISDLYIYLDVPEGKNPRGKGFEGVIMKITKYPIDGGLPNKRGIYCLYHIPNRKPKKFSIKKV